MRTRAARSLVRPLVTQLHAYVPGEQPKIAGLVKLNTNENPFPPSPATLRAIRGAIDSRLRLYPNPTAQALREQVANYHRCAPSQIIAGNGSDDLLAMCTRAFVEPWSAGRGERAASMVQCFTPSYSLYPVLTQAHGALLNEVELLPDFGIPKGEALSKRGWNPKAALSFVTTPNAPSGRGYTRQELNQLCRGHRGVLVLDEAYVDFAKENAAALALRYPHVLVLRTFSKAYSLCHLRVGYAIGAPALIAALDKVRDSYNVNGLAQVGAQAALTDLKYYRSKWGELIALRQKVSQRLTELGFHVFTSQTNFLLVQPPVHPAEQWLQLLRERKILVRWFKHVRVRDYLRISLGTSQEMDKLVAAARDILRST
jgi:histidinol-phosphate aminotransferase